MKECRVSGAELRMSWLHYIYTHSTLGIRNSALEMAYELILVLNVTDDESYQQYRDAMRPILEAHGGGFRYDFRISETLKSQADHPINRVFAIYFSDKEARSQFFANEAYQSVRRQYFEPAVDGSTVIASHELDL